MEPMIMLLTAMLTLGVTPALRVGQQRQRPGDNRFATAFIDGLILQILDRLLAAEMIVPSKRCRGVIDRVDRLGALGGSVRRSKSLAAMPIERTATMVLRSAAGRLQTLVVVSP